MKTTATGRNQTGNFVRSVEQKSKYKLGTSPGEQYSFGKIPDCLNNNVEGEHFAVFSGNGYVLNASTAGDVAVYLQLRNVIKWGPLYPRQDFFTKNVQINVIITILGITREIPNTRYFPAILILDFFSISSYELLDIFFPFIG